MTDNIELLFETDDERLASVENIKAHTRKMNLESDKMEMDLNDLKASADEARQFPFFGDIEPGNVSRCIQTLDMWSRRNPGQPMQITFSTYGGNVIAGLALYDFIKELRLRGHFVTCRALSVCASMGAILLQAGDERVATPNTLVMLHEGSGAMSGTMGEMADTQKLMTKLTAKMENITCERSGMSVRKFRALIKRKDVWLDAKEALDLGLIDRISE